MLTIALSTSGLGGIVSGMLADRVGKRTLLSVTVLVYSLGSLLRASRHRQAYFCWVAPSWGSSRDARRALARCSPSYFRAKSAPAPWEPLITWPALLNSARRSWLLSRYNVMGWPAACLCPLVWLY